MEDTLARVKTLVAAGDAVVSEHAYERLAQNGIFTADVEDGIEAAIEIENYPEFYKGPSVLVLQRDLSGQPIHVLWGIRKGTSAPAVVITAYRPDPLRWTPDFRSRL